MTKRNIPKDLLTRYDLSGIIIPIVVLFAALSVSSEGFLSSYNMTANLQSLAVFALIGLAQMVVLSLGQFNLAVGSMGCLSGIIMGYLMQGAGWPIWVSLVLGVAVAGILGLIQGLLTAKSGITPFIITLGLLSVYKGAAYVMNRGEAFQDLPASFMELGNVNYGFVPLTFVISIVIGALVYLIIRYLRIGKKLLACGANPRASLYSGINYDRTVIIGHTFSGCLCGFAAILQVIRFGSAQLSVGSDWMMSSFMAPVLGGTLLSGGKISVLGTFIGALLVVLIKNALILWGATTFTSNIYLGLILLLAYEINRLRKVLLEKRSVLDESERK
jgi:ribose transport system permease protein